MTVPNEVLQDIIEASKNAMPGPWEHTTETGKFIIIAVGPIGNEQAHGVAMIPNNGEGEDQKMSDASFIVSACNHAAEMAAELLEARKNEAKCKEAMREFDKLNFRITELEEKLSMVREENERKKKENTAWASLDFDRNIAGQNPTASQFMINAIKRINFLEAEIERLIITKNQYAKIVHEITEQLFL